MTELHATLPIIFKSNVERVKPDTNECIVYLGFKMIKQAKLNYYLKTYYSRGKAEKQEIGFYKHHCIFYVGRMDGLVICKG